MLAKSTLRKLMLSKRNLLANQLEGQYLLNHIPALLNYLNGVINLNIAGYVPIGSEFNILPLLIQLEKIGFAISLPAIIGKQDMVFRQYRVANGCNKLTAMKFGTLGPDESYLTVSPDVILLPLLACDNKGNRLGYGKGFYDRYITKDNSSFLIGVGYDFQLVEYVPAEETDARISAMLTPKEFLVF